MALCVFFFCCYLSIATLKCTLNMPHIVRLNVIRFVVMLKESHISTRYLFETLILSTGQMLDFDSREYYVIYSLY